MKTSYTQLGMIEAPTDCVHALAFSVDGRYLASASNDNMVRVYGLERGFATTWEEKGDCPFTAVTWRDNALFAGTMDGDVICFHPTTRWIRRRKSEIIYKTEAVIQSMVFNQRGDHLLVCSGADVLLFEKTSGRWKYRDCLPRPEPFGEPSEGDTYPIVATGVHFLENEKQCLIGYLYNGFWKFNLETWESTLYFGPDDSYKSEDPRRYFGRITDSAKSPDSKAVVTTDTCVGLAWFKVMLERHKKMSTTNMAQNSNVPLPVLFINQGQAVIMGTTKGCALILEVKRAEKLQTLKHGNDETWVTSLAYIDLDGRCRMIATGDGNREQRTRIILWSEDKKDLSFKFPKLWYIMPKLFVSILRIGRIVLTVMGVIFALSLWSLPLWTEATSKQLSGYFSKSSSPAAPSTSPSPVIPATTSSPFLTKVTELLDTLGELLVRVDCP
ncbi:WD40-repeat-containing domain protein [Lentinula aff. lateritia]|uniref:WD40-repeat-containing domain protein n=1 Tax=Lentinula aff. lateritia TaxID=2804960 RepID=A0ACC1TKJ9_9AGAR|nr:WD40-repeat-containing domain protein [Lentinula aff. lateritia]